MANSKKIYLNTSLTFSKTCRIKVGGKSVEKSIVDLPKSDKELSLSKQKLWSFWRFKRTDSGW